MRKKSSSEAAASDSFDIPGFLKTLTTRPGVYRMLDDSGQVLYVGKARNLKNRVSSYFRSSGLSIKNQAMVNRIRSIEVTITASETEALLLEQNLIKSLHPPYNILLRDDKSYPYIHLSEHRDYPALTYRRARSRRGGGRFFGPYPSSAAVRESLNLMQKIFLIRQCEESFFRNRSRPCLQYQIKRCSAPCVQLISLEEYMENVRRAVMFLEGKNPELIQELIQAMEQAAGKLEFEKAARYRDQIDHLRHVQEHQAMEAGTGEGNLDVLAIHQEQDKVCVQMVFVRGGRVLGSKSYFPKVSLEMEPGDILQAFVCQYYLGEQESTEVPDELILSHQLPDEDVIASAFLDVRGRKVRLANRVRSERSQWLRMAQANARHLLHSHLASQENIFQRLEALRDVLGLESVPQRIECFDISHSGGESTVASCVVFGEQGPIKSDYRRFNIAGITPGDDYAAMEQALSRRYSKLKTGEGKLPDVLLIDGGKGQVAVADRVLEELQVTGVQILGVAKGVTRKPGMEMLILGGSHDVIHLGPDSPALHLIQQVRDEAHRFAITGHRQRRDKKRRGSRLEDIPGIGPKRRRDLLNYFGGLREIQKASLDEIAKVPGISRKMAETIHAAMHDDG